MVYNNISLRLNQIFHMSLFLHSIEKGLGKESIQFQQQHQTNDGLTIIPMLTHHTVKQRYLAEMYGEGETSIRNLRLTGRNENLFDSGTEVFQGYGSHYIDLWVGSPPQRQTVLIDTGSSSTAFPCTDCEDCGKGHHMDEYYDPKASSTFKYLGCHECLRGECGSAFPNECRMHLAYAEGSSWDAIEASDLIHFGGFHNVTDKSDHISVKNVGELGKYDFTQSADNKFRLKFGCQLSMDGLFKVSEIMKNYTFTIQSDNKL